MSYLSQFIVDKRSVVKYRFWDSYAWHRAIWRLFPGREKDNREFLFRIDPLRSHVRLLLLSPCSPCLPEWGEGRTKKISPRFLKYGAYRFQLKANPTKRSMESRKRVGIYNESDLMAWLERKAESAGFRVVRDQVSIGPPLAEYFNRNGKKGKHISVDFSGVLEVKDHSRLEHAFYNGIGPAKAFGFGMLMLQPI